MKHIIGGIQWAVFLLASSIAAPIAIAHVFGMDTVETTLFIQRTMFVLGLACLIQAFVGHRLPINEGPAGLWWGIFVVYAGMVGVMYPSSGDALQALQSGMIVSGILFILLAITGLISKMKTLFTPAVTFTYLMLLILQLSGTFLKGMVGVETHSDRIDGLLFLGSLLVVLVTFFTMNHKVPWVKRYSVLLSIGIGWILFLVIGKAGFVHSEFDGWIQFPQVLVYGMPVWDSGMFITAGFITLLLIANMMASIRVMESLLKQSFSITPPDRMKQGSIASGLNHLFAGLFSAIGPVPISGAAGFVGATRIASIKPFIVGSIIVIVITIFPAIMSVFAALPAPVAYAVTFAIFTKMVEMAFRELSVEPNQERGYKVAAVGLMIGVGIMFIPQESMSDLPNAISAVLSNGLITGTVIAILIEQFYLWRERRRT
ncbi:purine/pyrimidine permease [Sporosarcina thermotolerans]|uniref:Purine/pyrimidine permease n=1 Tax=Sporosarcina thermotolerans TaxID=633404 RepID=A0AAW9A396_9BACL|nr:purine/pyrimidine permease [Sporosarcina thermotolerans]MDW0115366.1 purine/pyrimidine permease [Sporosarcina thermotolerans]